MPMRNNNSPATNNKEMKYNNCWTKKAKIIVIKKFSELQ